MNNILISGAASGIGAATARLFHQRGWRVGLLDINAPALAELAAQLGGAWHQALDVSDVDAVAAALAAFTESEKGRLRLLFNCAGILRVGRFEEISLVEHARIMQVNVIGLLQMTHAAFPYLRAMPGAQVINMGSASGVYGVPQFASYSASKFAVRGFTEALEIEWQRYDIRVGDLMPPFVRTPMVSSQSVTPPILDRLGIDLEAEDIAEAVWLQAHDARVHRPVSTLFTWLYRLGQITPAALTRLLMRWVSRP
jgi:NAD(P)-dependent dehydrogenase (short-subunit alcohol dehydrogenase family)